MLKILTLNASPVKGSSTSILLDQLAAGILEKSEQLYENRKVDLNELKILPCQSCGESPAPDYCFYHDDIYPLYEYLINCDIVLFGSPVYFDTVSAQAKLFIDRCNCLRPPDFKGESGEYFRKIISKKRFGAMVLVGGQRGQFECARRVIAVFFKCVRISNCGTISYASDDQWWQAGRVGLDTAKLAEARLLGNQIISNLT